MFSFPNKRVFFTHFKSFIVVATFLCFIHQVNATESPLFTAYNANPVFSYSAVPGSFDENQIRGAAVIYHDGLYRMYYTAVGNSNPMTIGLATSVDGIHWNRYGSTPVFKCGDNTLTNCGSDSWSSYRVMYPTVIFDEGMYKMWFNGDPDNGPSQLAVGYATSSDGVTWDAYDLNPIFPGTQLGPIPDNGFLTRGVTKLNGMYYMYYYKNIGNDPQTYVATSTDGIHWNLTNNNQAVLSGNNVMYLGTDQAIVYFNNNDILVASSDGLNFVAVSSAPLTGETSFDFDGNSTMLVQNNMVHVWRSKYIGNVNWSGGNFVINYFTAPSSILLNQTVNHAPVLAPINNQVVAEGGTLSFVVSASDQDNDQLSYSAVNLPAGATFNPQTQQFNWTPSYNQAGNYENVEFTVTDNGNPLELDVELITISVGDVNRAPEIVSPGSQTVLEDNPLSFTISATDPDGDAVSITASNLPSGATFSNGIFTWTPSRTQSGIYTPTFTATDTGLPIEMSSIDVVITVGDNPTPTEQTQALIDTIVSYTLPQNLMNSYLANLQKIIPFIEAGQIQPAKNQLQAFITKVNQDYTKGKLTLTQKDELLAAANAILQSIQ